MKTSIKPAKIGFDEDALERRERLLARRDSGKRSQSVAPLSNEMRWLNESLYQTRMTFK